MPDDAPPGLPRIALVFGDESEAAHVREAIDGHVDVAYATAAADFDATRLADARVAAALVNLDGGDWLDAIDAGLDSVAVPAVYNDPDISRGLEGWARARWLRHLLAKLRGSADVDPPRPVPAPVLAATVAPAAQELPQNEPVVVERPLSPQEIETMTADFVAVPQAASAQVGEAALPPAVATHEVPIAVDPAEAPVRLDSVTASSGTTSGDGMIETATAAPSPDPEMVPVDDPGFDRDGGLDVDTEALSAMIDARLADSESKSPADSPEVWRVVEGETVAAERPEPPADRAAAAATGRAAQPQAGAGDQDDADVLASLPSLDDWQLVDDTEPAPAVPAASAPIAAGEDDDPGLALLDRFSGLELVPMETVATAVFHTEPIERWLNESEPAKGKTGAGGTVKVASTGGKG